MWESVYMQIDALKGRMKMVYGFICSSQLQCLHLYRAVAVIRLLNAKSEYTTNNTTENTVYDALRIVSRNSRILVLMFLSYIEYSTGHAQTQKNLSRKLKKSLLLI